ncbi:MAG: non-ribosomal peptide synthetase [Luteolibacter sp.]|uniref:non-ribosomal peptide synthetase n=1 Tax=Luteolibacter sp. TaxID=1962973 RepID=UPI003267A4BC
MEQLSTPDSSCPPAPLCRWTDKFERQAKLSPSRTAVISGNESVTYAELSSRSNQIANLLRSQGIGRGNFVGLGLHRSLELPAALLGILKSGAAYVPLDPGYPAARIEQMISSADLKYVVTNSDLATQFPNVRTICMDDEAVSSASTDGLDQGMEKDDLIYAIFTSGSTGQPKAASVYHRGFENLLRWYSIELDMGPSDRTLIISSPSFDLTQKNFFAPLITGGTLILDDCQTYDISRISALIRELGVTLINCTPSAFYPLVDAAANEDYIALASLRFAVLGGEPISISRLRPWLEHPNCRAEVMNSYGPTECTDICAFHRLHRGNLDDHPFVPLGREIPNVQVSIVDEAMVPLPDGEIGELCISGAGIGGGYLNDAARTAEAFTGSIYRTGDLAKRLPSGILEFRGRADHQVKVNGFRIELGEIEIALNHHQEVREAVVIASNNRLIAYVHGTAETADLHRFLIARLPSYMIPGEIYFLENFPLTPNGKVDRLALAATLKTGTTGIESGASTESKVLALWSEILDRPVDDATANFFDLGGNSIHLAIIHIRLMEMIGRKFPITELFALPSARSIADFLSPKGANTATASAQDRARQAQAGFSRFRRPTSR